MILLQFSRIQLKEQAVWMFIMMGIGVGTPLIEFIFATCTLCMGMTLGVIFCCLYIRISSRRVSGVDTYVLTDMNNQQNEWDERSGNSTSPYQTSAAQECCTIYVPDVGIIL